MDLGRQPIREPGPSIGLDDQPAVRLTRLWEHREPSGVAVEIGELEQPYPDDKLRRIWRRRLSGRPVPLLLFAVDGPEMHICGPDEGPDGQLTIVKVSVATGESMLRQVLELPAREVVRGYLALVGRSQGSAGVAGLRNRQLLTTHYLTRVLPREDPAKWRRWGHLGQEVQESSGRRLFEQLGYEVNAPNPGELLLTVAGQPVAAAHVYRSGTNLDRMFFEGPGTPGVQPAGRVLQAAMQRGVEYAFLNAGSVLRLHRCRPEEEFEETAAPAAYVEFDLNLLPEEHLPLVGAVCSGEALGPGGQLAWLFGESKRYAVALRERFRDRVYGDVVPELVRGLWEAARAEGLGVVSDPQVLYRATLILLFRTLFVLYAEDRNLLPVGHPRYRRRSLTQRVDDILRTRRRGRGAFEPRQTDIWDDLVRIFAAVRDGHREWGVPPYDGGLFEDAGSPEAEVLAALRLPNTVTGPVLYHLAVDRHGEEEGKVDFGDLGVRHLGSIYEGLLSFRALVAERDLTVNRRSKGQIYEPARPGDPVAVRAGEPYLASPQGGRKATGSYYTPAFAVNRLVEGALEPVLAKHLRRLDGMDDQAAAGRLFDVKVCDPAMGSGHFLSRALDFLAQRLQEYLTRRPLEPIAAELDRARRTIEEVGRRYGAQDLGEGVGDFDLLRRIVLKRCIYGVDLNPTAVELAKLSLWLRAFVPGLPLSYLGHNLRCGDSLVGVAGPEFEEVETSLFMQQVRRRLDAALDDAQALGSVDDLELAEVERSEAMQAEIDRRLASVRDVYDAATGARFEPDFNLQGFLMQVTEASDGEHLRLPPVSVEPAHLARERWRAFHWPLAFPEVFLGGREGFDAVLGNPPWEEVTVEKTGFFVQHIPGLKSEQLASVQEQRVEEFAAEHPEIYGEYREELERTERLRAYLHASYALTRSGDPDLYRAFCERFLQLLRDGGSLGVVLPRTAFSGDGTAPFRERLFASGRIWLDFLLNSGGWVFPDAEHRYTLTLVVAVRRGEQGPVTVGVAGPADSPAAFEDLDDRRVEWTAEELRKASDGLEVPLIPDHPSAVLFRRLVAEHPRFDSAKGGLRPLPWRELDATKDRKSGLLREAGAGWPVYTGESFDLWNPRLRPPAQVIPPEEGLAELQRSQVWRRHFPPAVLADPATLPQHRARILFRDVTNRTNSRTVVACLVPPRVFATNKAPSLLFPLGDLVDQLYVLGLMCSAPFDWLARRRVETDLNFFILNTLPLPRPPRESFVRQRIAQVAGRLACPDERFRAVAEAAGVACGPPEPAEKADLIAELDALSARAYGLSEAELRLMFEDFPETEAGLSPARRAAVLAHFTRLEEVPA